MASLAEAFQRYQVIKTIAREERDRALKSPESPRNIQHGLVQIGELPGDALLKLTTFFDLLLNRIEHLGFLDVVSSFEDEFRVRIRKRSSPGIASAKMRARISSFLRRPSKQQTLGAMIPVLKLAVDRVSGTKLELIRDERNGIAHGRPPSQLLAINVADAVQTLDDALLKLP